MAFDKSAKRENKMTCDVHIFAGARKRGHSDDQDVIRSFGEIMAWVQAQSQFSEAAKADFANGADGWLVAYGKVGGFVVVTQEVPAGDARRKVPMPNVCQAFNVPFVDTFEMLRRLGVQFAWRGMLLLSP